MAASATDLLKFAARYGNDVLREQVKLKAPLWDILEHVKGTGAVGIVNPIVAGQQGASFIADGGLRPAGNSNTPVQGTVAPFFATTSLTLNNGALAVLTGREDSANYLDSQLKSAGGTLAQLIGTSSYAPAGLIGSPTAITSQFTAVGSTGAEAVMVFANSANFQEGMSYTLNDVSANRAFVVRCVNVAFTAAGALSVTFKNDVEGFGAPFASQKPGNTDALLIATVFITTDTANQRGSLTNEGVAANSAASGLNPVSLSDITSPSSTLYGISPASLVGWSGITFGSVGAPTVEAFIQSMKRVHQRSGDTPDIVVVSPMVSAALGMGAVTPATNFGVGAQAAPSAASQVGQTRRAVDGKLDKYGAAMFSDAGISISGKKVCEDVNLLDTDAYLINRDDLKFMVWRDIEAEKQGGDTLLVSQSAFAQVAYYSVMYNMYTQKRNSCARMSGLTL